MCDVRLEFFRFAQKFLFFFLQPVDGFFELTLFGHPFFMELGLFNFEFKDFLVKLSLLGGIKGLDLFELLFVDLDLFFQTGNGEFVLGDEFIPVFEGVDLHGGETVVREFQQLNFGGWLIQSNLVQQLFQGIGSCLSVLNPFLVNGLVGLL